MSALESNSQLHWQQECARRQVEEAMLAAGFVKGRFRIVGVFAVTGAIEDVQFGDVLDPGGHLMIVKCDQGAATTSSKLQGEMRPAHLSASIILVGFAGNGPTLWALDGDR